MNVKTSLTDVLNITIDEDLNNVIVRIEDFDYEILQVTEFSFKSGVGYFFQPNNNKFLNGCILKIIKGHDIIYKEIVTKYYGEMDTDKVIRNTYFLDYGYSGTMVELGAGPPEFYSMSKHFRDSGWRCICIDPNPKFVKQHKELGNEIYEFACSNEDIKETDFQIANVFLWSEDIEGVSTSALKIRQGWDGNEIENIKVEVKTLNTLLSEIGVDKIDFINIDTEGWELEVMGGFDANKYSPKVILLENTTHSGSYEKYMNSIGYKLDKIIEYNYIYIKK